MENYKVPQGKNEYESYLKLQLDIQEGRVSTELLGTDPTKKHLTTNDLRLITKYAIYENVSEVDFVVYGNKNQLQHFINNVFSKNEEFILGFDYKTLSSDANKLVMKFYCEETPNFYMVSIFNLIYNDLGFSLNVIRPEKIVVRFDNGSTHETTTKTRIVSESKDEDIEVIHVGHSPVLLNFINDYQIEISKDYNDYVFEDYAGMDERICNGEYINWRYGQP